MDVLLTSINSNRDHFTEEEANAFQNWYQKDENADPPQHILQPISVMAKRENRQDSRELWREISGVLKSAVRKSAMLAVESGLMTSEIARTFYRSG